MRDFDFMREALLEAKKAAEKGEIPIGAVLIKDGEIMSRAHNEREFSANPLDHAEMVLLRREGSRSQNWRLTGTTLYVTVEPCLMCLGALLQARVSRLVFGCVDSKRPPRGLTEAQPDPFMFPSLKERHQIKGNNHLLIVQGGVLEEECAAVLKEFFKKRRETSLESSDSIGDSCGFPNDF